MILRVDWTHTDIDRGIEASLESFLGQNPIIEEKSDKKTLIIWETFIAYCYCIVNQDNYGDPDGFLEHYPHPLFFYGELTPLMKCGMEECIGWGEKYYTQHVEDLMDDDDENDAYEQVDENMKNVIQTIETQPIPIPGIPDIKKFKALHQSLLPLQCKMCINPINNRNMS